MRPREGGVQWTGMEIKRLPSRRLGHSSDISYAHTHTHTHIHTYTQQCGGLILVSPYTSVKDLVSQHAGVCWDE
jgi:hypothetical protein